MVSWWKSTCSSDVYHVAAYRRQQTDYSPTDTSNQRLRQYYYLLYCDFYSSHLKVLINIAFDYFQCFGLLCPKPVPCPLHPPPPFLWLLFFCLYQKHSTCDSVHSVGIDVVMALLEASHRNAWKYFPFRGSMDKRINSNESSKYFN